MKYKYKLLNEEIKKLGHYINNEVMIFSSYLYHDVLTIDTHTLLNGMFSPNLPPIIDEVLTYDSCRALYDIIKNGDSQITKMFDYSDGFVDRLTKSSQSPENIHGSSNASESIKFFTIKIDNSFRPMAIPNIKHAAMFMYNSIKIADLCFNELYSKESRTTGKTSHSESPIIGKNGMFSKMLYNEIDIEYDKAKGYIGYNDTNKFFKDNKLQRFNIERTYPYVMHIDISKYFENIYTHSLANIDVDKIIDKNLLFSNSEFLRKYLNWIDQYNQKSNDNHTKGIMQGPISSKISSEILQIYIDQLIDEIISENNMYISFSRYVDDYRFYGRTYSDLELLKSKLVKLFRKFELSLNEEKVKIYKGFEIPKQSNLDYYTKIKSITKGKGMAFSFKDYMSLREEILKMIECEDIPTIKSLLTILKRKIIKKDIEFRDNKLVETTIIFLIKLSYVYPILSQKIYDFIYEILIRVADSIRKEVTNIMIDELVYVEQTFSDTDLEIWYFYVLINAIEDERVNIIFEKYLNIDNINPIILSMFVKKDNYELFDNVQSVLIDKSNYDSTKNINQISQSKWWIVFAKLWIINREEVNKDIKQLFVNNNNEVKWDLLGIIEYLIRKSH